MIVNINQDFALMDKYHGVENKQSNYVCKYLMRINIPENILVFIAIGKVAFSDPGYETVLN